MAFFLVTFSVRQPARDSTVEEFVNPVEAMERFVQAERHHRDLDDGLGAVLLIADDEATLRRTHTHYFLSAGKLLESVAAGK